MFKSEEPAVPKRVITASRLVDGAVVWRDAAGRWQEDFDRAWASDDDISVAQMLTDAQADEAKGIVVTPYEVEVEVQRAAISRMLVPTRLRERIRAFGPTIDPH